MSDKDEKREQPDVEGHAHFNESHLIDDQKDAEGAHLQDDDDTPDVEGHKHKTSPVRKHKT